MPNQSIHAIRATVTTYRSNSAVAFFDTPKDATPQDCKEITAKLIDQARSVIQGIDKDSPDTDWLFIQLELIDSLLAQASCSIDMLDIAEAVAMAQVEG
ncbi:hypothetical protein [Acinetobacter populi]|uniref:Uncharacterized protein n=1 Tax=Acinetobacter populi TaxID=1582270 RepID=A0A1Z9Z3E7_9GAMM|nr:hypothetical protein [Acinetobacter populi]OUY09028.1 hypothetical protein CAP51_05350 [Acinetobacter populi]